MSRPSTPPASMLTIPKPASVEVGHVPTILLAVALQRWDELSPHAVAAREAAVALAHGSGAQLTADVRLKEEAKDEKSALQIYEISRDDFEKLGRSTQEEAFIQTVIELPQGLDNI